MGRPKTKREKPPAPSPEEMLCNLARQIVNPCYPEHVSPFWDEATAHLLVANPVKQATATRAS
jgi:hypothetical protein